MKKKYTIIIVDDHQLFRDGLKFVLSQIDDIEVIGEAENGKKCLELLETKKPDLILMDISMPEMNGIEATAKALEKYPDLKIVALSMFGDQEYYFKMIHAGVKGFVLKQSGKRELEEGIRRVLEGDNFFSQELLRKIIVNIGNGKVEGKKASPVNLTKREKEVLQLICNGLANAEIAEQLNISPKTVDGHRTNLLSKTGARNSVSLVMYAIKNKIIEI